MTNCTWKPYSDEPNAPRIPDGVHFEEWANLAGCIAAATLYGVVISLFFKCMGALLNPVNRVRSEGIRWGLVAQTAVMFSLVTVDTAMSLHVQSISYIDARAFPGIKCRLTPGPLAYQEIISIEAVSIVPTVAFLINQWLADALLLYRCYVIYGMSYFVIAFPSLMYLGSVAVGILLLYTTTGQQNITAVVGIRVTTAFYSMSLATNLILTLLIVIRLLQHSWNIRSAMGPLAGGNVGKLYNTIVTMLVESFALYAANLLPFIALGIHASPYMAIFAPLLVETQVITPLLVILRVANKTAFTTDKIPSVHLTSINFKTGEGSVGGDETNSNEDTPDLAETESGTPDEVEVEATIEEVSRS